jgi:hypothetical protein
MNPRDVNRINYNNYYVGQNLDFLVRSKMRSESLSTPLKNTPPFYDDQVTAKMSLLGKRGYYDPGYIYGFSDENDNANRGQNQDIMQYEKERFNPREENSSNPILTREQYDQIILPKEHYKEQMMNNYEMYNNPNNNNDYKKYLNERNFNNNNMNNNNSYNDIKNNNYNDMNNRNRYNDELLYKEKLRMLKERQTPQRLDNFQLDRIDKPVEKNIEEEQNKIHNNVNNIEERRLEDEPKYGYNIDDERDRYYYEQILKNNNGMIRNEDKIPNKDYSKQISEYNYINELSKKSANSGNLVLPLTKSQILQGVLIDNFNKKHFSK